MQLTGPPRLNGIVRRYASADGPIVDLWEDRSQYLDGRVKKRLKGRRQLWPSWVFRVVCSPWEWLAWRSDLVGDGQAEFDWTPRTRSGGDPDWMAEHTYRARIRRGLPTLAPLMTVDAATGEVVYVVDVEIEGVEPYEKLPDTFEGGLYLLGTTDVDVEVEPYGDASLATTVYQLSIERPDKTVATGTFGYAELEPPPVEAARVRPVGPASASNLAALTPSDAVLSAEVDLTPLP